MAEKKWEDYSTGLKVAAVFFLLLQVFSFIAIVVATVMFILDHEYLKAFAYFVGWLAINFWGTSRRRKRKLKRIEMEVVKLEAQVKNLTTIRKTVLLDSYKEGYQAGIDFQRKILLDWAEQRAGQKQG